MAESSGVVKKVKVHYRQAKLIGEGDPNTTLQAALMEALGAELGKDTRERILPMAEDAQHQGCLGYWESGKAFFVADIMHLDGRTSLPRWIHPKEPKPYAEVVPREVAKGEASLVEPVYILVSGNHLAAIERMGFRTSNLAKYLNALIAKAGKAQSPYEWRLIPKIELKGEAWQGGGVKKVIVKPNAAVMGHAPSKLPEDTSKRKARSAVSALEDFVVMGQRVFDALVTFGADEAKLKNFGSR